MRERFHPRMSLALLPLIVFGHGGLPVAASGRLQAAPAQVPQSDLPKILKAAGDYCEIVKRMALYFVCRERISEKENVLSRGVGAARATSDELKIGKVNHRDFAYEYQIIKHRDDVQERRTLLEENGEKRHKENADLPTLRYSGRNLVFGPVGFLSRYWQTYFNYEITGWEPLDGKTAVIIRAMPKSESQDNNNHGRVWVDASTFQILRIELEPQIVQGSKVDLRESNRVGREIADDTLGANFHRQLVWTVDYGVEKKGVLFPSRQTISEFYSSDTGFKILKRAVSFEYTDYKYFTVEVDVR